MVLREFLLQESHALGLQRLLVFIIQNDGFIMKARLKSILSDLNACASAEKYLQTNYDSHWKK